MTTSDSILVIDVGTSSVRAAVVRPDATVDHVHFQPCLPDTPAPGLVEFDAVALADAALSCARAALADEGGPVAGVGIANQRASTVVWDRATGVPVGPGLGWQDLRTLGDCLVLQAEGIRLAPNLSATKLRHLLDLADPDRTADLCFGTVDTWLVWRLTEGRCHVTDPTNAALTGLTGDGSAWDAELLTALGVPEATLPAIVDSSGTVGQATALPGAPPIAGLAGDQQASLLGQGCTAPGTAKITFGTGGMLDTIYGPDRPSFESRGGHGCFPVVAHRLAGRTTWGIEAAMLSAGTNVEWLRDDLGLLASSEASHEVAASVADSGGIWYVPALLGLGTPQWDYGARGTLLGITRGTTAAHIVRAVLEGVAHRGADLVEAAEADGGHPIGAIRIDGGMSVNPTFVQALADSTGRPIEVSPVTEATILGAAFLAGLAAGTWGGLDDVAATWKPARTVEPATATDRDRWREAVSRASGWVPELSALDF